MFMFSKQHNDIIIMMIYEIMMSLDLIAIASA